MIRIVQAESATDIDNVRTLFREYEAWLGLDLCFQGFEEELKVLPGRYAEPDGRLYLAYARDKLAGCIALRRVEESLCEMKRLYLRPDSRGLGLGNALIERLIDDARAVGYGKMRLDTLPAKMGKAMKLYESHGFKVIKPYYSNPHEGVLFMELTLIDHVP